MDKICHTLCLMEKPKEYNKLFFGDYGNFQRIDKKSYDIFQKLAEASESNTWFTKEIDCTKDKKGWDMMDDVPKRIFHLNILYQNVMDSLVPGTFGILSDLSSDTWLSYLYSRIKVEEDIHALSYSTGLNQAFGSKVTEMLDLIYEDNVVRKRADKEIESANKLIEKLKEDTVDDELKKLLLENLLRTFFLEGVKFPFSFFSTWSINKAYGNSIQGFSQMLKLIAWDEMTVHTTTGANVMKILMKDDSQGFLHLKSYFEDLAYKMAEETSELEIEWSDYLLKDGDFQGFNQKINNHFIKYWTDYRLKEIGLKPIYKEEKSDVIEWYNEYRNLNKTQVALQEADNTNYQKGSLKNDLDKFDLKDKNV